MLGGQEVDHFVLAHPIKVKPVGQLMTRNRDSKISPQIRDLFDEHFEMFP